MSHKFTFVNRFLAYCRNESLQSHESRDVMKRSICRCTSLTNKLLKCLTAGGMDAGVAGPKIDMIPSSGRSSMPI